MSAKVRPDRAKRYLSRTQPRRKQFDVWSLDDLGRAEDEYHRWISLVRLTRPDVEVMLWDDLAQGPGVRTVEWRNRDTLDG